MFFLSACLVAGLLVIGAVVLVCWLFDRSPGGKAIAAWRRNQVRLDKEAAEAERKARKKKTEKPWKTP